MDTLREQTDSTDKFDTTEDLGHKNKYHDALESAYQTGASLQLPELDVFGAESINRQAIQEFTLELICFIEEKELATSDEQLERLYHFGRKIQEDFFSASPCLINYIHLRDRLKLMTRATRSNVVRSTFGSTFVGETVYDISFMNGSLNEIVNNVLRDISIPEQLDLLHQLRTVGAQAIADGASSRTAYEQVKETYAHLANSKDATVFVQLAAQSGLETLNKEYRNPQLSVIRLPGQTSDSRLASRTSNATIKATTDKLFSTYNIDRVFPSSTKIVPATRDALVCLDMTGLATGVIKMDVADFLTSGETQLDFNINKYRIYKQSLDNADRLTSEQKDRITIETYQAIYDEYARAYLAKDDADGAARVFADIFPMLSEAEWKIYFIGEILIRKQPSEKAFYRQAENRNVEASKHFLNQLLTYETALGSQYTPLFIDLKAALEKNDLEHAFQIASSIISRCAHADKLTDIHEKVISLQSKMRAIHQTSFQEAKQAHARAVTKLQQTKEIVARAEIIKKIDEQFDNIRIALRSFLEKKLAAAQTLPQLKFTSLKDLTGELSGEQSSDTLTSEDVLLFQHVHSSELAEKIQTQFGFTLSDLSLKEQYFFLNYLKRIKTDSIPLINGFVTRYGIQGMRTFLSLERGDKNLGDQIIMFGQHPDIAGTVFTYYTELLDSAERAEILVRELSDCTGNVCIELTHQVRENIITRAQKDLEQAVRTNNPHEVANRIETYIAAAKEYVALLQEIGGGKIESISSKALSDGDRDKMQDILKRNYEKMYPESKDADFKAKVEKSLTTGFSNPDTVFKILRHQGKIVCFHRFDTVQESDGKEVTYFGSFNADPAYSGVGGIMLEETIQERLRDNKPMVAHCIPDQPITRKYIEDGFIATRLDELGGHSIFEIWRSEKSSQQIVSKQKTIDNLVSSQENTDAIIVREQSKIETYPELQHNMGLTRYFIHQGKTYLVFEILPIELQQQFTFTKE